MRVLEISYNNATPPTGVEIWNAWRNESPDIRPDLSEADFGGADLGGVCLNDAILREANLSRAVLREADLS